ncbi:MAG: hypothetical protein QGH74_07540 [Candidatus Brocadiia bacterium]|nr:hypothetical protein [Candidatus Brocadiia bacterium]
MARVAARVLEGLGVKPEDVQERLKELLGPEPGGEDEETEDVR